MQIRTPLEIGLAIRDRRRKLKLSQAELASKVGVGRQWVVAVEQGKPRAEVGLILRTFSALNIRLAIDSEERPTRSHGDLPPVDIDAVVNAARKGRE